MKYYCNNFFDVIGRTPLAKIPRLTNAIKSKVFAKVVTDIATNLDENSVAVYL